MSPNQQHQSTELSNYKMCNSVLTSLRFVSGFLILFSSSATLRMVSSCRMTPSGKHPPDSSTASLELFFDTRCSFRNTNSSFSSIMLSFVRMSRVPPSFNFADDTQSCTHCNNAYCNLENLNFKCSYKLEKLPTIEVGPTT